MQLKESLKAMQDLNLTYYKMKLHIGGKIKKDGWKIMNIQKNPEVDFIGDLSDLSQFQDESIEEIYTSHVLEHVPNLLEFKEYPYKQIELIESIRNKQQANQVFDKALPLKINASTKVISKTSLFSMQWHY